MNFRLYLACLLVLTVRLAATDEPAAPAAAGAENAASASDDGEHAPPHKPDPAEPKYWQAVTLLGKKNPADMAAGRLALQAAADMEYTHAQTLLADCYLSGSYGFPKDARKAVNLLRLAAERGNAFAKVSLGSCYFTGTGVRKDQETAASWLTAAIAPNANFERPVPPEDFAPGNENTVAGELETNPVDSAQATAHYLLGQIATKQKKLADAQAHYVAAATAGADGRAGVYPAAIQAALNYALGQGVPRDQAKANEMLDQSRRLTARMGVALIHNYSTLKILDEFAVADMEESAEEAGEHMLTEMQFQLGRMFADKKSKDYNAAEAVKWYELAANSGQTWAMLSLAFLYHEGVAGAPDDTKAFQWLEKAGGGAKPKHYLGVANLAVCYQNGIGTAQDTAKAAELFSKYRDYDIVCYLGTLNQCPKTLVTFEDDLKLNETWAKKNDPQAQYLLGIRYRYGWGVKADFDTAERWLKKAAKANHGAAYNQLGIMNQELASYMPTTLAGFQRKTELTNSAIEYVRKGSELGDASAMANYATAIQSRTADQAELKKAEVLFLKALEKDPTMALAHNNLAALYEGRLRALVGSVDSEATNAVRAKMLEQYEAANALEYGLAANNLGRLYHDGVLVKRDYQKAYSYFETAAARGLANAHYQLGLMHEKGEGVAITYSEAAYHYRLAALDGNIDALRRLVNFYLTGQGVTLDLDRAAFWLQRMAQLGQTGGLTTLAEILLKKGDYENAISLLKKLSDSENNTLSGFACERLGQCYQQGLGVKADPAKAQKFFARALQKGDATALTRVGLQQIAEKKIPEGLANLNKAASSSGPASYYLGQMYYFGTNVPQDRTKGLELMRKSAGLNHPDALYFLAAMTYNKEADAPPLDEAIRFAQQAENSGLAKATDVREKLERRRKGASPQSEEKTGTRSS